MSDAVLEAGARLGQGGKYEVRSLLGQGASGRVYEAIHSKTRARCAIKVLRADADGDARERMLREARALAKLEHPHIVRMLDYDETSDGAVLIVQELLEGETLRARLDHALVLGAREALALLLPVLDALAYAHERAVIHRDVKPENIALTVDARGCTVAKLLDFGLSRDDHDRSNLTRAGTLAGTPRYMSPEQAWGRADLDARTDLWSFGVVLYECCSGALPYDGANDREVLASIVARDPPHLRSAAVAVDDAIADAVMLGLARAPEARVASAKEYARALRRAMEGVEPAPAATRPPSERPIEAEPSIDAAPARARGDVAVESPQRRGRGAAFAAIGAIALLAGMALLGVQVRSDRGASPVRQVTGDAGLGTASATIDAATPEDAAVALTPLDAATPASDVLRIEPRTRRSGATSPGSRYDGGQEAGRSAPRRGANSAPIVDDL